MELETHQASEEMTKFFNGLEEIKALLRSKSEETQDHFLLDLYERLDKIFKVCGK